MSLKEEQLTAEKEKEKWQSIRDKSSQKEREQLDQEFKKVFEQLQNFFYRSSKLNDAEQVLYKLKSLADKGASAQLLDPYELGGFNTAGVVKELPELLTEKELNLAVEVVRLSLLTGADIANLKAYAGNGGSPALYWLCDYLSRGIAEGTFSLKNTLQYGVCFRIFCLILAYAPEASQKENYCAAFLQRLIPEPAFHKMQLQVYFRLVHSGLVPSTPFYYAGMFPVSVIVKYEAPQWLPVLFPYPEKELNEYLQFLEFHLKEFGGNGILNGFKATKEGRKYFSMHFNYHPHWLLTYTIENDQESIFGLVRGQELEMLEPFFKHYKKELSLLRDKKGNTLLHQAALSRNSSDKLFSRLIAIGFSETVKNNEGKTAAELRKNKK